MSGIHGTVRARCSRCRSDVEVGLIEVTVLYASGRDSAEYLIDCPTCNQPVRGTIRPQTAMELATLGARLIEPLQPLTDGEIADFVDALGDDAAVGRALQGHAN
jgi:hypothetical protein